jgi:ribulose 1,5-bisphosphate synthetase/thiazole synthase
MKSITEPARDIQVALQTDVLLVGSGPGGLAAGTWGTELRRQGARIQ